MVQDSPMFASQQLNEQVEQRRDGYAQQNIDSFARLPDAVSRFQQGRAQSQQIQHEAQQMQQQAEMHQAALMQTAEDLAFDQLHRQQAQEDLAWSQQVHQVDMIGLQRRGMEADIALKEAQTKKAIEEIGGNSANKFWQLDEDTQDHVIGNLKLAPIISGGHLVMGEAPEDQSKAALSRIEARASVKQKNAMELQALRNQGGLQEALIRSNAAGGRSGDMEAHRTQDEIEARVKMLSGEIDSLNDRMGDKRKTYDPADIQRLTDLQSERSRLIDAHGKMTQDLVGGGQKQGGPRTPEEVFAQRSQEGFKMLGLDGAKK